MTIYNCQLFMIVYLKLFKILNIIATIGATKENELSDLKIKYFLLLFKINSKKYEFIDSNYKIVI
jgi:hypothetical protein